MNHRIADITPRLVFSTAVPVCLYVPFSHWAINSELFGKHDMGWALFFSFSMPVAIYVSVAIFVVSLLLALFYRKYNRSGKNILLTSAFVSVLPFAYLWALDVW